MDFQIISGYLAGLVIGISLGLIGAGGSILTVPALVYLLGIEPVLSTAYSLFVVGTTALVGAADCMRKGLVHYRAAAVFAVPSFIAVFVTRKFIVPALPDPMVEAGNFVIGKSEAILLFFALIMAAAGYSMIRKKRGSREFPLSNNPDGSTIPKNINAPDYPHHFNLPLVATEGFVVGMLTGLVGAGGGFLIIPALVLFARLPMKLAVGTSLLIIAAKSLIGFTGDIGEQPIDWHFLFTFTAMPVAGIFIGGRLSKLVEGKKLQQGFGWFVLAMAGYMIFKELF